LRKLEPNDNVILSEWTYLKKSIYTFFLEHGLGIIPAHSAVMNNARFYG
jgi:hypothetical protein